MAPEPLEFHAIRIPSLAIPNPQTQIFSIFSAPALSLLTALVMAMPVAAGTAVSWTGGFFLLRTNRTIAATAASVTTPPTAPAMIAPIEPPPDSSTVCAADELVRVELVMSVGVGSGGGGGETAGGEGLGSAGGGGGESAVLVIVGSANTLVVTPFAARAA